MEQQGELEDRVARELDGISPMRREFDRWFLSLLSTTAETLLRRWLLVANVINGTILAGAVLVPLMMAAGLRPVAGALFAAYHLICLQNPDHSYFLMGYQLAMDQRMVAIFGSTFAAGLAFVLLRGLIRTLPWRVYFLLILPIAIDGFTQLFGWRTSNWELRTLTGVLFGTATVWLTYPPIDRALRFRLAIGLS